MNGMFPVDLTMPANEPLPRSAQIVFHGINKSGSLALSNVLRDAYEREGRIQEFVSHYHMKGFEGNFPELVDASRDGGFFVGHYLYGALKPNPNRILISQFRHPLPRVLSCYTWLKNKYEKNRSTTSPYPTLDDWIVATKGKSHSQIDQFGVGFGRLRRLRIQHLSVRDIFESAAEAIDRDLFKIGIAEHFEESIFLFASLCGLKTVRPWVRDVRNPGRPHSSEIPEKSVALINDVFSYDFKLYEYALEKFWDQFLNINLGDSLNSYKRACLQEYNDRITA